MMKVKIIHDGGQTETPDVTAASRKWWPRRHPTASGLIGAGLVLAVLAGCGSTPAPVHHVAHAARLPSALAILKLTGATPNRGEFAGDTDVYGDGLAAGSFASGELVTVYTYATPKSEAAGLARGAPGQVQIKGRLFSVDVNPASNAASPAEIARRVDGTVVQPVPAADPAATKAAPKPKAAQSPAAQPSAAQPPPAAPAQPALTNGVAVISQYYQDITDHDYAAAWAIGGSNIAAENGQSYSSWEAGYADTTASISITSYGTWSNGTVWCYISAVQLSGAVNTYYGTYDVANGVIVSASIRQAG